MRRFSAAVNQTDSSEFGNGVFETFVEVLVRASGIDRIRQSIIDSRVNRRAYEFASGGLNSRINIS